VHRVPASDAAYKLFEAVWGEGSLDIKFHPKPRDLVKLRRSMAFVHNTMPSLTPEDRAKKQCL